MSNIEIHITGAVTNPDINTAIEVLERLRTPAVSTVRPVGPRSIVKDAVALSKALDTCSKYTKQLFWALPRGIVEAKTLIELANDMKTEKKAVRSYLFNLRRKEIALIKSGELGGDVVQVDMSRYAIDGGHRYYLLTEAWDMIHGQL